MVPPRRYLPHAPVAGEKAVMAPLILVATALFRSDYPAGIAVDAIPLASLPTFRASGNGIGPEIGC
jgi:hypothetical protein